MIVVLIILAILAVLLCIYICYESIKTDMMLIRFRDRERKQAAKEYFKIVDKYMKFLNKIEKKGKK